MNIITFAFVFVFMIALGIFVLIETKDLNDDMKEIEAKLKLKETK